MGKFQFFLILVLATTNSIHSQLHADAYQQVLNNAHNNGLPAIAALVQTSDGTSWKGTAGFSSIEQKRPLNLNHSFRLASISKIFTSVVILQLAEENKLDLTAKISNYLPKETISKIPFAYAITILHLLSHSSGIYSFTENNKFWKEGYYNNGFSRKWSPNELINYIEEKKPASEPLTPFSKKSYSNTNFILLGMIIESITGNTLDSEYQQRIFSPLHMNHTFLEGFDIQHKKPIASYANPNSSFVKSAVKRDLLKKITDSEYVNLSKKFNLFNSWAWSAGGISSNINDLQVFLTALKKGELLSGEGHKVLTRLNSSEDKGITFFGGTGGSDGIQATMLHLMPSNISIIILLNSTGHQKISLGSIFTELLEIASEKK